MEILGVWVFLTREVPLHCCCCACTSRLTSGPGLEPFTPPLEPLTSYWVEAYQRAGAVPHVGHAGQLGSVSLPHLRGGWVGFRVQGPGFRVKGAGCRVQGPGSGVQGGTPH